MEERKYESITSIATFKRATTMGKIIFILSMTFFLYAIILIILNLSGVITSGKAYYLIPAGFGIVMSICAIVWIIKDKPYPKSQEIPAIIISVLVLISLISLIALIYCGILL